MTIRFIFLIFISLFSNASFTAVTYTCDPDSDPISIPPESNACSSFPTDISDYTYIPNGKTFLTSTIYSENYYVEGDVFLDMGTGQNYVTVDGNIYATGDVTIGNKAVINGFVYTEGGIEFDNNGNIDAVYGSCACAVEVPPPIGGNYEFVITTLPDGLTCEAHEVAIQVLLDSQPATGYLGTINLSTEPEKGIWSLISGAGALTLGSLDDGTASYQFAASDNGIVELGLFYDIAGDVTVNVTSGADAALPGVISFRPFQLKSELSCVNVIPGFCITTANLPFSIALTAVGKDQTTGACKVIEEYTGVKELKFWSSYLNPTAPVGVDVEVNQTVIKKNATDASDQPIDFLNGVATVSVNYPDAGKIQIHARDDQGLGAPPSDPGERDELQGSAITIVNPLKLLISPVTANPAEIGSYNPISGAGFKRAAVRSHTSLVDVDVFDITVKAVIDCSNDLSNHCTSSENPKAPSFNNSVTLLPSLVFPNSASAALGTVHSERGPDALLLDMVGGELTYSDLSYDEVGTLGLQATSIKYLGIEGNDITASDVKNIGRFFPDYLAYGDYVVEPACNDDFTYLDQQAISISYNMKAYAQGATKITLNYDNSSSDDSLNYPVAKDFSNSVNDQTSADFSERLLADDDYPTTHWVLGEYHLSKKLIGVGKLTAPDGPFFISNNALDYFIKLTGIDGEALQITSNTLCEDGKCKLGDVDDLAYGQLQAGNGHGSEFQIIRTNVQATYFNGSDFVPMQRDQCTTVTMEQVSSDPVLSSNDEIEVGSGKTTLTITNETLINGLSYFDFSAPQVAGELDYYIDLHTETPWLLDSGNEVECFTATAGLKDCIFGHIQFGLYRGNERIIFRLQTFN